MGLQVGLGRLSVRPIFASLLVCEQQQQGTFCDSGSPRFPCIIAIILKLYVEQEVLTRAAFLELSEAARGCEQVLVTGGLRRGQARIRAAARCIGRRGISNGGGQLERRADGRRAADVNRDLLGAQA